MNVTPLVDIVLVLLIIFMVITPRMEAGANVELPKVKNSDPRQKMKTLPITVTVTATGAVHLERERLEVPALETRLRELQAREPLRRVVIKADRAARYGDVRAIFKRCQGLGQSAIALQVGEIKAPPPPAAQRQEEDHGLPAR